MAMKTLTVQELRQSFGLLVVAGFVFTIFISTTSPSALIVLVLPLAAMGLYLYWYWRRAHFRDHVDQFADSFYYAGFLFTLFSLAGSFLPWALSPTALSSDQILARFGVALSTTLFGLSLRVWLTQFQLGADDAAAEARASITEAAQALGTEVRLALDEIKSLRTEMTSEMMSFQKEIGERLKDNADEISRSIKRSTSGLEDHLGKFSKSIEGLGSSATALGEAGRNLSEVLAATSKMSEIVEGVASASREAVSNSVDAAKSLSELAGAIRRDAGEVDSLKSQLVRQVEESSKALERLQENVVVASNYIVQRLS